MGELRHRLAKDRGRNLTISLTMFFLVGAFTQPNDLGQIIEMSVFLLVLGSGVAAMAEGRRTGLAALALSLPFFVVFVLSTFRVFGEGVRPSLISAVASLPFLFLAYATTYSYTVKRAPITPDRLYAAGAAFLLMGVAWSGLYALAELTHPGSFRFPGELEHIVWNDLVYFSLVTQTTLGYGDITPASYPARTFAILQACSGLFYMGAVVARLVADSASYGRSDG